MYYQERRDLAFSGGMRCIMLSALPITVHSTVKDRGVYCTTGIRSCKSVARLMLTLRYCSIALYIKGEDISPHA